MNWLSMMSDEDKHQIVKELTNRLSAEPILASAFENAVEKVLTKYKYSHPAIEMRIDKLEKFISPRLTTADQPLIDLIHAAKDVAKLLRLTNHSQYCNTLDRTADAVAKLYSVKL